jgi:hypothetical protein
MPIDSPQWSSEFYIDPILLVKKIKHEDLPRQGPFLVTCTEIKDGKLRTNTEELYFECISKSGNFMTFWSEKEWGKQHIEYFWKGAQFLRTVQRISAENGEILYSLWEDETKELEQDLVRNGEFTPWYDVVLRPGDNFLDPTSRVIRDIIKHIQTLLS